MDDDSDGQTRWPACHRCHSSKLRCRRAPNQRACNRCIRAQAECSPRPSRRGQQVAITTANLNNAVYPTQGTGSTMPAMDLSMGGTTSSTTPPDNIKALDSSSLGTLDTLDSRMLQAMDSWPRLSGSDISSPINPLLYQDFFHLTEVPTALGGKPQLGGLQNASASEAEGSQASQMDRTMNDSEQAFGHRQSRTTGLDARVHELARLNILLVNQQEATAESIHALRASPEAQAYGGRQSDYLNLEETLRIALQLLSILRQSAPAHDPATALLFLSCYSRLAAIFRNVFECLQRILDEGSTISQRPLSRLFPRVQLGSVCLGDGSERLQAEMVLDASEHVFTDISMRIELILTEKDPTSSGGQEAESQWPTFGMLDEGIRIVPAERSVVTGLVDKLRSAFKQY